MNAMSSNNNNRTTLQQLQMQIQMQMQMHQSRRGRSNSGRDELQQQSRDHDEEDDDLALFNEMNKIRRANFLTSSEDSEPDLGNMNSLTRISTRRVGDDLLSVDGDKNDYEWLLSPPPTPFVSSADTKAQGTSFMQRGSPAGHPTNALRSLRLSNPHTDSSQKIMRGGLTSRQTISSGLNNSVNLASGRSSMLAKPGPASSRSSTPTRSRAPASSRPSTPTRSTVPASSRPSTPTTRSTIPSPSRPSTPTSRSTIPTSKTTVPTSKSLSRPSTPTRRPSTPSLTQSSYGIIRSSAGSISNTPTRNLPKSRGSSPSPVPRSHQPPVLSPDFSIDTPPSLSQSSYGLSRSSVSSISSIPSRNPPTSQGSSPSPAARSSQPPVLPPDFSIDTPPSLTQSSYGLSRSSISSISSIPTRNPPTSRGSSPSPVPRSSQPPVLPPDFSIDTPPSLTQSSYGLSRSSVSSSIRTRNEPTSRGSSPSPAARSSQPPLLPIDFSNDTPRNLRTTMPQRPSSVSRARPGASSSARSATEAPTKSSRPRGQSCSPVVTRGRILSDNHSNGKSNIPGSRSRVNGSDVTMPIVLGSKMVDKVTGVRSVTKGHEDQAISRTINSSLQSRRPVKPTSSPDSSGFGRTISKKSLDMALRHMDIRQSTPSSRPLTSIPTSSLYSVRSGSSKSKPTNISESPIASSSSGSSEHGAMIAPYPEGNVLDDYDVLKERENILSPLSQQGSILFKGDEQSTNWLHGPENVEDKFDQTLLLQKFEPFDALADTIGMVGDS